MSSLTVLGIDPGFASTGFAIADVSLVSCRIAKVHAIGISKTEPTKLRKIRKTSDDLARARQHAGLLRGLVDQYAVDVIAYEMASTTPYTLPNFSFGVMMGIVATLNRPIIEVLNYEVKQAATGDRNATKADVIRWAVGITGRQKIDWPTSGKKNTVNLIYRGRHVTLAAEHPADALAAIQAAIGTEQFHLASAMASPRR